MASVAKTTDQSMPLSTKTDDDSTVRPHPGYALSTSGHAVRDPLPVFDSPTIITASQQKLTNAMKKCVDADMSGLLRKLVRPASKAITKPATATAERSRQQSRYLLVGYTTVDVIYSVVEGSGPLKDNMRKAQPATVGGSAPPNRVVLPGPKSKKDLENQLLPVVVDFESLVFRQDNSVREESATPPVLYVLLADERDGNMLISYRVRIEVVFYRAPCRTLEQSGTKRLKAWPRQVSKYARSLKNSTHIDYESQANANATPSSRPEADESIDDTENIGNPATNPSRQQILNDQSTITDHEMHDASGGEDLTASHSNTAIEPQSSSTRALQPTQISKESVSDPQIRTRSLLGISQSRIKIAGDKRKCTEISPLTPQYLFQNGSTGFSHTNTNFPSKRYRGGDVGENEAHDEVKVTKSRRIQSTKSQVIKAQSPNPEPASKAVKIEAHDVIEILDDDEASRGTPTRQPVDPRIIEKFIDIKNRDWTAVDSSAFISKVKEIWSQDGNKQHLQDLTTPLVRRAKSVINNLNPGFVTVSREVVPGFLYSCMRFPDPSWDDVQQAHQSLSIQISPARIAPVQRLDDALKFAT